MTRSLVILGAGGNAHDVLDIVEALNRVHGADKWEAVGYLDDSRPRGVRYLGLPVLGSLGDIQQFGGNRFIVAIRNERVHRRLPDLVAATFLEAASFATLVHPTAGVSKRAEIGRGVYINFGASIAGGVRVGDHASIGPGCILGHDVVVEPYAIIAAGAIISGGVTVGRASYVGAGASIRQNVRIGEGTLVGMGAVVVRDVSPGSVVVGNPARPMTANLLAEHGEL